MKFSCSYFVIFFLTGFIANISHRSGDWKDLTGNPSLKTFLTSISTEVEVHRQLATNLGIDVSNPSLERIKPILYRDVEHTILKYDVLFEVPLSAFTAEDTQTQFQFSLSSPYLTFIATISEYQENITEYDDAVEGGVVGYRTVPKLIVYDIENIEESVLSKMVSALGSASIPQELKPKLRLALRLLHKWKSLPLTQSRESETLAEAQKSVQEYLRSIEPTEVTLNLKFLGKTVEGSSDGTPDVYVAIYEYNGCKFINWIGIVFKMQRGIYSRLHVVGPTPLLDSTKQVKLKHRILPAPLTWENITPVKMQGLFDFIKFGNKWSQDVYAIFSGQTDPFIERAQDGIRPVYFCSLRKDNKPIISRSGSLLGGLRTSFSSSEYVESQGTEFAMYLLVAVLEIRGPNPYKVLDYSFYSKIRPTDYKELAMRFRYRIPAV